MGRRRFVAVPAEAGQGDLEAGSWTVMTSLMARMSVGAVQSLVV
jgi:hypothetical protein